MSDAQLGHGSCIEASDMAATPAFTVLAEVVGFTIEDTDEFVEATHLKSPGRYREYISGLKDVGTLPLKMRFLPNETTVAQIFADKAAGFLRDYRFKISQPDVTAPDTKKMFTLSAFVESYSVPVTVDGIIEMDVNFRVSGAVSLVDEV